MNRFQSQLKLAAYWKSQFKYSSICYCNQIFAASIKKEKKTEKEKEN